MRFTRMKFIAMAFAAFEAWCALQRMVLARSGRDHGLPMQVATQKMTVPIASPKLDLYGDPLPAGAVMRFGTIRHRQKAPIYRIAFTRDDRFIVTDGDDGQLRVWDGHDGKLLRRIAVGIKALSGFALSADGKVVATAGIQLVPGKGIIRDVVFNEVETGREVSRNSWLENTGLCHVHASIPIGNAS